MKKALMVVVCAVVMIGCLWLISDNRHVVKKVDALQVYCSQAEDIIVFELPSGHRYATYWDEMTSKKYVVTLVLDNNRTQNAIEDDFIVEVIDKFPKD